MSTTQIDESRVRLEAIGAPTGVAILGCGYWGINYVRVFRELTGATVVAVCDQNEERLLEVKRRFPDVHTTTELEETLSLDGVNAVVICTPATTHYRVT